MTADQTTGGPRLDEGLSDEFDTVAAWTSEAVGALGEDYALPAACRGSGSPSVLAWLAEAMGVLPGQLVLDAGAGVGGPAQWLREHYRVRVVAVEPMRGASLASRRLFGLPAATAWAEALPVADQRVDAVWSLGVLDTTPDRPSKVRLLAELRRVLPPHAPLGLTVVVRTRPVEALEDPPEGNDFPTVDDVTELLTETGFATVQSLTADSLSASPVDWQARADRVEAEIERRHGKDPRWSRTQEQGRRMGRLLGDGQLSLHLVHAVAA